MHNTISTALNEQIGLEGQSSHTYLTMAVWAETQGFDGVAEFLYAHSEEERQHMLKLMRFVNERGAVAQILLFTRVPRNTRVSRKSLKASSPTRPR